MSADRSESPNETRLAQFVSKRFFDFHSQKQVQQSGGPPLSGCYMGMEMTNC
jgi:hypothetical protein